MHYPHLFLAGTFDGLHAGHRAILTRAFAEGKRVTIGLTTDAFVRAYKPRLSLRDRSHGEAISAKGIAAATSWPRNDTIAIHPFEQRKRALEGWLGKQGVLDRATVIPIADPYEPAASMPDLDALIVTPENRKRGEHINALRYALGVSPLALIEVPMVEAQDGKPVSSTRLRNGEIDSDGRLIMPEELRKSLHKPLGRVLKRFHPAKRGETLIVTVGDVATKTFLDAGIIPELAIIDGMVGRKPFPDVIDHLQPQKASPFKAKTVKSGPGYISREAVDAIRTMLNSPKPPLILREGEGGVIVVDGEEDLLVLPAILHAPLGSILYYGQPGEGLVEVRITKSIQQQVRILLSQFAT